MSNPDRSARPTRRTACLLLAGVPAAAAQNAAPNIEDQRVAPYYPTPLTIGEQMLKMASLKPGERMYDLGSGDGRLVILAAQKFKADATGVELDHDLVVQSSERIRERKLQDRARIIEGDLYLQDYAKADLITVYLLPAAVTRLRPLLERQLRKGTRVVAHDFPVDRWSAAKAETIEDDGEGRSHTLYLYVR